MQASSPEVLDIRSEIQKLKEQIDQIEIDQYDLREMLDSHTTSHYADTTQIRE
jgi:hypothetical protein